MVLYHGCPNKEFTPNCMYSSMEQYMMRQKALMEVRKVIGK